MLNTRMKDFFDLAMIARNSALEGATLTQAIQATFARRGTVVPQTPPAALTIEFSAESIKVKQWQAFLSKAKLKADSLPDVIAVLNTLLWPPTQAAAAGHAFTLRWAPRALGWQ